MARRKSSEASGVNLDSLMDTLTNVVGILIIILILVQINVSQALKKIVSELPEVSVEELQKIKEQSQAQKVDHEKLKQEMEKLMAEAEKNRKELEKVTPELAHLETTAKQNPVPTLDLDTLRKQLEEKKKELEKRKASASALLAEQQRLKGLLDSTPVVAPPPGKVVRIPNSRPIPEKAKIERYLITAGQLYYLDMDAAKKMVLSEFQATRDRLEKERTKAADGSRKVIYDQEKVAKHFAQRRLAYRNLDIKVPANKVSNRVAVQLVPRPGQGEHINAAAQLTSRFQNDLRRFKTGNTVVWFHVARDGFDTYLRARDICDAIGVPAGWEAVYTPAYSETLAEIEVNRLEQPKPPDPNQISIKPPTKKLD